MAIQLPLAGLLPVLPAHPASAAAPHLSLWTYPDCPTETLNRHAKMVGAAGELLFDSHMARLGLLSCPLPETLPADRLLVVGDRGLRVQVKATTHAQAGAYRFSASRGYNRAPGGVQPYAADAFDLLALVVLPENVIAYTTSRRTCHGIPVRAIPGLRAHPRDTLEEALRDLGVPIPDMIPDVATPADPALTAPGAA
jgi:hypothetical protein